MGASNMEAAPRLKDLLENANTGMCLPVMWNLNQRNAPTSKMMGGA